ncbi:MAG: phosphoribosyl-ATP diphosphatase [Rhodospirillales bacterium CG15_BIG_FIL_POST_REV_8_21_14_020_66_15]|nr:MAG: phosphoribosyl-ATP diphosphatase [Rhodospirillales bacterium CG15_BIG_FIL_POST_REV_8_21_14_020_66_15]
MTHILDDLFATIDSRKTAFENGGADPATSYTAKLFAGGAPLIARKLGEEAVETAVAALTEDTAAVAKESADVLYHLLALWAQLGLAPADVWAELERRTGQSGIAEKNSRTK